MNKMEEGIPGIVMGKGTEGKKNLFGWITNNFSNFKLYGAREEVEVIKLDTEQAPVLDGTGTWMAF